MKEERLNRTGRRPFGFVGEQIYEGNTKDHASIRWDVVRMFRTPEGYVMGVARLTCMEGERDFYQVRKFKTKEDVMSFTKKRLTYLESQIKAALDAQATEWQPEGGTENVGTGIHNYNSGSK